jgi:hypothetical protein
VCCHVTQGRNIPSSLNFQLRKYRKGIGVALLWQLQSSTLKVSVYGQRPAILQKKKSNEQRSFVNKRKKRNTGRRSNSVEGFPITLIRVIDLQPIRRTTLPIITRTPRRVPLLSYHLIEWLLKPILLALPREKK